jgi:hypothetical protein
VTVRVPPIERHKFFKALVQQAVNSLADRAITHLLWIANTPASHIEGPEVFSVDVLFTVKIHVLLSKYEMRLCVHVKCPIFLSDFYHIWIMSSDVFKDLGDT